MTETSEVSRRDLPVPVGASSNGVLVRDVDDADTDGVESVIDKPAEQRRPRPKPGGTPASPSPAASPSTGSPTTERAGTGRSITLTSPSLRLPRRGHRPRSRTSRIGTAILALLVTIALMVVSFEVRGSNSDRNAVATARVQAASAAAATVPKIIGYSYQTFDADAAAAQAAATGRFRSTLATLDATIKSAVVSKKVIKKATITASSVTSASASAVTLLLFVTQTNTVGPAKPALVPARLRVTMTKTGGTWLVSDIAPV